MKRLTNRLPLVVVAACALYVAAGLRGPKAPEPVKRFARLPVLQGGRLKPLDSVARNALLSLRGKQSVYREGKRVAPAAWLLDVVARPETADRDLVFRIDNPDVLSLIGNPRAEAKYFSYADLEPHRGAVFGQGERAGAVESVLRSPFQRAVFQLANGLGAYERLRNAFQVSGTRDLPADIEAFTAAAPAGLDALHKKAEGKPFDAKALMRLSVYFDQFSFLENNAPFFPVPPSAPGGPDHAWTSMGAALFARLRAEEPNASLGALARMMKAWGGQDMAAFDAALDEHEAFLARVAPKTAFWARVEEAFNRVQPLVRAMALYLLALMLACASWVWRPRELAAAAGAALAAAFLVHTAGLVTRMILEGRPPVTNLYSSAVFVGWGAALLGLILERLRGEGLGAAAAGAAGFASLIVAHHLTGSGDTMEMMRAVLDSNFWLATHVVTITIGYSATYLAGFLAVVWILRRAFTRTMSDASSRALADMTYGILCFATLFSFVGTVLGGIWADQSWGRFWGWDPKENGALLIVLWNAIILHARWGGYARERGIMVMAVFGNVVTSLSWFGVNMLGIGLHSYGFMDKALYALIAFILLQAVIMGLAWLPSAKAKIRP